MSVCVEIEREGQSVKEREGDYVKKFANSRPRRSCHKNLEYEYNKASFISLSQASVDHFTDET